MYNIFGDKKGATDWFGVSNLPLMQAGIVGRYHSIDSEFLVFLHFIILALVLPE